MSTISSAEASIEEGREAYANGQYKLAIQHFTLVSNKCPCNNGKAGRRERCKCKDFARVAREGGDIFREAMHTCSCGVSQKFNKCHDTSHIQALEYRIHVFDKMSRPDHAKRDAEWLLEIAPRALEGYLRLGKVYRLSKEPKIAHAIWTAGIDVAGREGLGGNSKLKQLIEARAPLHRHFVKIDPLRKLPPELVESVLCSFTTLELARLQCVSKYWNQYLWNSPRLWAHIRIRGGRPPVAWLKSLAKYNRGAVDSTVIDLTLLVSRGSSSSGSKFASGRWPLVASATRGAKDLTLNCPAVGPLPSIADLPGAWSNLSKLRITLPMDESAIHEHRAGREAVVGPLLLPLLHLNKASLEELSIAMPSTYLACHLPEMQSFPRIQCLQLDTDLSKLQAPEPFLGHWAVKTPNLKQLCLQYPDGRCLTSRIPVAEPTNLEHAEHWNQLQAMRIAQNCMGSVTDPAISFNLGALVSFENYSGKQRPAAYTSLDPLLDYCLRVAQDSGDGPRLELPVLERYWGERFPVRDVLRPCLAKSFASGTLAHIGLTFPSIGKPLEDITDGTSVIPFLKHISWMRGQPSVRTLGFFHFDHTHYDTLMSRGTREEIDQMVDFACSFPNVDTFVAGSGYCKDESVALMVEKIAARGQVKRFILFPLAIWIMDAIKASIKQHGAEVTFDWEQRKPPFPLRLESARR